MTQTIKKCNEIPQGKIYPVEHLRTAESIEQLCELVDAGHPLATNEGEELRLFHKASKLLWRSDFYCRNAWGTTSFYEDELLDGIKLAPLAYRNGRPLHVGDTVKIQDTVNVQHPIFSSWSIYTIDLNNGLNFSTWSKYKEWRFADEVEA